jgi:hypothetical protein
MIVSYRIRTWTLLGLSGALLFGQLIAGCQRDTQQGSDTATTDFDQLAEDFGVPQSTPGAQQSATQPSADPGAVAPADTVFETLSGLTQSTDELNFASNEGRFQIVWPAGCRKLRTSIHYADPGVPADERVVDITQIFCDRKGLKGEGCRVVAYFEERSEGGGPPNPQMVNEKIRAIIEVFRVNVFEQNNLQRDMMEGIEVRYIDPSEVGQVWIQGFLAGNTIYLLTAWKQSGGLFGDRDYLRFFETFAPYIE